MNGDEEIIMDETALVAAGRGSRLASMLIHRAAEDANVNLYTTTCALVEADRARPGTADHFAALPAVKLIHLDLMGALAVARDTTWTFAHTRHALSPSFERPLGAAVATADPDRWKGLGITVIDVRPSPN